MTAPSPGTGGALHHLELWTGDLAAAAPAWDWLLTSLGWRGERVEGWDRGRIWRHGDGAAQVYLVLEQSPDLTGDRAERTAPGMNHLALRADGAPLLDRLRAEGPAHGWTELFAEAYPHAGGPGHTAWFAQTAEGIEVEVVAGP